MSEERRTIGPYEIVRLLGKGGMSEVYEVENSRLGSRHALKLFTYEKDDPEVKDVTPFDGLAIGGGEYMQLGENDALRMLLSKAIEKLRKIED